MSKILIIEDEAVFQKILHEVLMQEGLEVLQALDGESGTQLAKKEDPDLILLEIIVPKKDGFEVLEELKRDEKTKDIKIVILSNLETSFCLERALELGAEAYLVKSNYDLEEIVGKVKDFLQ